jgi:hypothetical protein
VAACMRAGREGRTVIMSDNWRAWAIVMHASHLCTEADIQGKSMGCMAHDHHAGRAASWRACRMRMGYAHGGRSSCTHGGRMAAPESLNAPTHGQIRLREAWHGRLQPCSIGAGAPCGERRSHARACAPFSRSRPQAWSHNAMWRRRWSVARGPGSSGDEHRGAGRSGVADHDCGGRSDDGE